MLASAAPSGVRARRRTSGTPGRWTAVAGIALFYTGATVFLYNRGLLGLTPAVWLAALAAVAAPALVISSARADVTRLPIVFVWLLHLGVTVAAYAFVAGTAVTDRVFRDRALATVLLVLLVLLLTDSEMLRRSRQALGLVTVLASVTNLVDVVRPLAFSETFGRSAGLYENPNRSGAAIVLAAVLAWDVVPARWRAAFLTATAVGTFLTLSRAAIITYVLFLGMLGWQRVRAGGGAVPWRVIGRCASVAIVILGVVVAWQRLPATSALRDDRNVSARLAWFRTPTLEDDAAVQRVTAAGEAWDVFSAHPLTGEGLGASREGELAIGTHNAFLSMLVEYGIGGGLLGVGMIGAVCVRSARPGSPSRYAAVVLFAWAMVNHNVFEDWVFVIAMAVAAAIAYHEGRGFGESARPVLWWRSTAARAIPRSGGGSTSRAPVWRSPR